MENWARHDLVMVSGEQLGLKPDREPRGLADGHTSESIAAAKAKVARLRASNPDIVVIADVNFYEYDDQALPEEHPWWLRVNGERQQFWPGTHRMDWYNPEYRTHVVKQSAAVLQTGVDGLFYDNLREEPDAWVPFLTELRRAVGERTLVFANTGYAIEEYDFAAPFLNGLMYESGWSHGRTEWDETIRAMQHSASLLRQPRISVIERFEEIRDYAGWPGDSQQGKVPQRDPAARRWSLCYALIIGDYYYLFSDNTSHQHDWYPEYDAKIGLPAGEGQRLGSHVWQRRYERALVVVNLPGAKESYTVQVQERAKDAFSGESGTGFVIRPGDGKILVFQ